MNDIHQVRIMTDFAADGIAIYVVLRTTDRHILHFRNGMPEWEAIPADGRTVDPTLRLSDGHGRALLNALLQHYNGTPDSHTQREDLMHERERRDKLEDAVVRIALATSDLPGGQA